jgi:hypothetical protein
MPEANQMKVVTPAHSAAALKSANDRDPGILTPLDIFFLDPVDETLKTVKNSASGRSKATRYEFQLLPGFIHKFMTDAAKRLTAVIIASAAPNAEGAGNARERLIEHLAWTLAQFPFQHFALIGTGNGHHAGSADDHAVLSAAGRIATVLRRLPSGIFVAAGDMPFISADMVEWLLGHDDPAADAVVPRHGSGIEPLFAIYSPGFAAHLDATLKAPGDALLAALDKSRVRYVETPEALARSFERAESEEACARALAGMEKKFADPSRL